MADEKKPKSPRKHNPAWKDANKPQRNRESLKTRRATLDQIARDNGWQSWHVYETAVLKGDVKIAQNV